MANAGAAFSVRFLRNGDQIIISANTVDQNGDGAPLYQIVDSSTGNPVPDWSVAANQPIITLEVVSAAGYPVRVTNVNWAYDGIDLTFDASGNCTTTGYTNKFKLQNNDKTKLRIIGNIASQDTVSNKQITYTVTYVSNSMTDQVTGSVDILIQQAGQNSHIIMITANRTMLSEDDPTATLTASARYGTSPVTFGQDNYLLKWSDSSNGSHGDWNNHASVTIDRDDIYGGCVVVAQLYKNNVLVASDQIRINDISDQYQIVATPQTGANSVSYKNSTPHNALFDLTVLKNGSSISGTPTYAWQIYDARGNEKTSGTTSTVTVTPADCISNGKQITDSDAEFSDVDVSVTAQFS